MEPVNVRHLSWLQRKLLALISGWDAEKYFKRRAIVTDPKSQYPVVLKLYYLFWIKRKDARHGCSFGTNLNIGNRYATAPILSHGPKGVVVGYDVEIGSETIIYQQVTIAAGGGKNRKSCRVRQQVHYTSGSYHW